MSARIHTHESVAQFIEQRFNELALRQLQNKAPSTLQNVTVRLPKGEIAAIDKMATFLDMSRQELLFELIGAGMEQAISTAAGKLTDAEQRTTWVKEMVSTWGAYDVELEGQDNE